MSQNILIDERDGAVFDVAWHPSGKYVATTGTDGILKIFRRNDDDKNKFEEITVKKREFTLRRVDFSPDGSKLLVAGFDKKCVVYAFLPGQDAPLKILSELDEQESEIKSAHWSNDGKYIITASRDKTVFIYDAETYDFIAVHSGHMADVKDAMFSPDSKYAVSVSFDETVRVWESKEELGALQTFKSHAGTVWSLAFNENGDFITLGEDGKIILYSLEDDSYKIKGELLLQKELEPLYSAFFCEGKWYVAGSLTKIFVVDCDLSKIERVIPINQLGDINSIKVNPINHSEIMVGNDDGTVQLVTI
jgi:WD40 repeat protein